MAQRPKLNSRFASSKKTSVVLQTAKLPPQNIEAEQSLLGALLIDKDAIVNVAEVLHQEDFYRSEQHGLIFSAILTLFEKREPIDVVTVTEVLRQNSDLDKVGGVAYLAELVNQVPTAAHIMSYARIIKEHSTRRRLITDATKFVEEAYDEGIAITDVIEECEQSIFAISQQNVKRDFIQLKDAIALSFDRLDELQKSSGKLRGVPTGFRDLDRKLAGFQDSNLIILAARPGIGKCLAYDSKIVHPQTGQILTIEQYFHQSIRPIHTLSDDLKLKKTQVSRFVDDGIKPVFKVKTRIGREIEVTASHPFLTAFGWKRLSELKKEDAVALPRAIPVFGSEELEDFKIKALAYYLSDGGLTSGAPRFTNTTPKIVNDFLEAVMEFPNVVVRKYDSNGTRAPSYEVVKDIQNKDQIRQNFSLGLTTLLKDKNITQRYLASQVKASFASVSMWVNGLTLPSDDRILILANYFSKSRDFFLPNNFHGFSAKSSLALWLDSFSLMGKNALEKQIPGIIFTMTKPKIALFLNRIFACDGCIYISKKFNVISYASSSKKLIDDICHLLLRFGIIASIREKHNKYKEGRRLSYELEIRDAEGVLRFCREIGVFAKEEKQAIIEKIARKRLTEKNFSKDSLPIEIWDYIIQEKGDLSWRAVYQKMGLPITHNIHARRRNPRRSNVLRIAKALNSKKLEDLARSDIFWDRIVSIEPMGKKQVYDLVVPETHNFVANDFFVHNTSMSLNIAQYVAVAAGLPVGIFSLEMSQEELVDRLLVTQADIDAWKLKTGNLSDSDFARLSDAMGQLAEAPMFIDDTPGASLAEIRTKARRLQVEHGLRLIVVDYLQLIRGSGRFNDNRVQEVSEISQGLKNLARELKVPVLALSQLSRQVEQRGTRKPQLADLRESGCLAGDTLLMRADTGKLTAIKDLVGQINIPVFSLNANLKLEKKCISKVFSSGLKKLYEIKTRSGRLIKASANHPFLTIEGWKRLDNLKSGMHLAMPRRFDLKLKEHPLNDDELILLAHLIGDGCVLPRQPIHYTSGDPANLEAVGKAASRLFGVIPRLVKQKNWWHLYLPSPYYLARGKHHPIMNWFKELGISPVHSYNKVLPLALFSCSQEKIAFFLNHLWSTDGNISWKKLASRKPSGAIYYATTSKTLADQIQHLLLRLGILSSLRQHSEKTHRMGYQIHIQGTQMQSRFCELIGSFGVRGEIVPSLMLALKDIQTNPNLDIIPKQAWKLLVEPEKRSAGLGWREVSGMIQTAYCGSTLFKSGLSRQRLLRLATAMQSTVLTDFATSDVFWDEITSITPLGVEEVFDATVSETHNFVANDFIVHNSIEQDADVVMFLYREDPEAFEQVKLDIQKHRNGPTGEIDLIFKGDRVKFYGMEKARVKTQTTKEEKESAQAL